VLFSALSAKAGAQKRNDAPGEMGVEEKQQAL
jgi:hypothetical protein